MGIFNRHNRQPKPEILPGDSNLVKRLKKFGMRGIIYVDSPEGSPVFPEDVEFLRPATGETTADTPTSEESALHKRLRKYGARGMIHVPSPEGARISEEDVKYLRPAGD